MDNLNKKQKITFIAIASIMIIVIGYYIMQKTKKYETIEINELIDQKEVEEGELKEKTKEESQTIIIHIAGSVKQEGIIKIEKDARISDVIEKAGGLKEEADISNVNLAYMVQDGQKIYIPSTNDKKEEVQIMLDNGENIIIDFKEKEEIVNINKASQTELEMLNGIGASTALKIIEYRNENGTFQSIEEIKSVPGIGEAKFENIKNNICI